MIDQLLPHSAYKVSGLPWVPRIPEHWTLVPNRALVRRRKILVGKRHTEYRLLSLTKQGVIVRDISSGKGKFSSDMGTSQEVRNGDLVFCLFDVPETPRTVALSPHHGMITGAYTVFEPKRVDAARFFELFYCALDERKLLSPLYSGLRNTIPAERFLGTRTPLPPLHEQAAIVRFLDHADRRIERCIRGKRKLIALLNEQKQAIIHRAVTLGLDPNVPMKDSGVPWLGAIPAHWEVRRAKQLCSAIVDCKNRTPEFVPNGEFIVVRTTNIRDGRFRIEGSYKTDRRNFEIWTERGAPRVGDVFFTREAPAGEAALVPNVPGLCMGQRMMYLRPNPAVLDASFLLHSIYGPGVRTYIDHACNGSTVGHLRLGQVGSLPIAWCPVEEQKRLVDYVERASVPLIAGIAQAEREIALMREYRTRLISDVVTGQLDVREAARNLPDLEPEATALDPSEADEDATPEDDLEGDEAA